MSHSDGLIDLGRIQREALAAAALPGDLNHHCPYPFGAVAAQEFAAHFHTRRAHLSRQITPPIMTHILTSAGREHCIIGPGVLRRSNAPSIQEIAHSLAQINRFTGHASRPYSVAEHSILVATIARHVYNASPKVELAALMHDAHECITGDVATPIKQFFGDAWDCFEVDQQHLIRTRYGILETALVWHKLIKKCDLIALATERRDLMPFDATRHAPWPVIDSTDEYPPAPHIDLNDHKQMQWHHWAAAFETCANDLMSQIDANQ